MTSYQIGTTEAIFFTEYLNNRRVHPIHFLLAGFGIVQFYSLLLGNVGLFIILAIVIYFSRKIDWGKARHPGRQAILNLEDLWSNDLLRKLKTPPSI